MSMSEEEGHVVGQVREIGGDVNYPEGNGSKYEGEVDVLPV